MLKVPLNENTITDMEKRAVAEVMDSGFMTFGQRCLEFEDAFAKKIGSKNAVFVNSGSSANLLAFFALANPLTKRSGRMRLINPGDEVIVPALSWSTSIWPIVQAGGVPVLVDCDPLTLQMKPESVADAISDKSVGICAVHVLGNSVDLDAIQGIAKNANLWLVEDTCESLGAKWGGKHLGTVGTIGTYSFYFSHHITTIEGGMLVTDDDDVAEVLRCLRAHGWTRHLKNKVQVEALHSDLDSRFLFVNTGFNVRPCEINAAIGLIQLEKLELFNQHRIQVTQRWKEAFSELASLGKMVPMQATERAHATWFGFPVICDSQNTRDGLKAHLEANNIETRPVICGNMARQPAFKYFSHRISGDLSGSDIVMDRGLFWGSHPGMTNEQVDFVIDRVKEFFKS